MIVWQNLCETLMNPGDPHKVWTPDFGNKCAPSCVVVMTTKFSSLALQNHKDRK